MLASIGTCPNPRARASLPAAVIAHPPIPLPEQWTLGDLERMRLILRGGSVIDWRRLHFETKDEVDRYLRLCLFEPNDPFDRARLQRILDEAVDYLRSTFRYPVTDAAGSVNTRHSVITKLLAKKETLAAQVYDRVRYRVTTEDREHVLPVLVRLCDLLIPFNFVVPGQTQNTLFSFRKLVHEFPELQA